MAYNMSFRKKIILTSRKRIGKVRVGSASIRLRPRSFHAYSVIELEKYSSGILLSRKKERSYLGKYPKPVS